MNNTNSDGIILSFHEALLRRSDIELLNGPYWLNDQIISFYFEYLEKAIFKTNKELLFVSAEVSQCLKLVPEEEIKIFLEPLEAIEKSFIFFPINDHDQNSAGGSHWSLLVFSRPESKFFHFDSNGSNYRAAKDFVTHIESNLFRGKKLIIKAADCLQQKNGYDCGIHVLCNALNVAEQVVILGKITGISKLIEHCVKNKRSEMLDLINQLFNTSNIV